MEPVDKSMVNDRVRIGIGTPPQHEALRKLGAERVIETHQLAGLMSEDAIISLALRPGDVVLVVQPTLFSIKQLKEIGGQGVVFQVPGHEPMTLRNDADRRMFRRVKPKGVKIEVKENRGGKVIYPQPTTEQVAAIVALWHSSMTPARINEQVQEMMGAEVPKSWVRDQVIKAVGSARRNPHSKEAE